MVALVVTPECDGCCWGNGIGVIAPVKVAGTSQMAASTNWLFRQEAGLRLVVLDAGAVRS